MISWLKHTLTCWCLSQIVQQLPTRVYEACCSKTGTGGGWKYSQHAILSGMDSLKTNHHPIFWENEVNWNHGCLVGGVKDDPTRHHIKEINGHSSWKEGVWLTDTTRGVASLRLRMSVDSVMKATRLGLRYLYWILLSTRLRPTALTCSIHTQWMVRGVVTTN